MLYIHEIEKDLQDVAQLLNKANYSSKMFAFFIDKAKNSDEVRTVDYEEHLSLELFTDMLNDAEDDEKEKIIERYNSNHHKDDELIDIECCYIVKCDFFIALSRIIKDAVDEDIDVIYSEDRPCADKKIDDLEDILYQIDKELIKYEG